MPKVFWKGIISFGMVSIPVSMSLATRSKTPSFHLLHKKCLTRPKQVLYCSEDDEYFSMKDTVRGYEYTKDQYVVLDDSDFQKVPVKTAHTIDILGFVDSREIDPIYYYDTHYLQPEELGVKPFILLKETLLKTNKVGIAKVAFQRREHLCSLRPLDDILVLHSMHYRSEILPAEKSSPAKSEVTEQEMQMATTLVESMTRPFKPEEYKDEYTQALQKMVEAKVQGQEIEVPEEPKVEIEDLMATLRASVEQAQKVSASRS
jgi:DNA end-binding protein Ku